MTNSAGADPLLQFAPALRGETGPDSEGQSLLSTLRAKLQETGWLGLFPWAVGATLCLALAIRLVGLDKGIWLDEYASLNMALRENLLQTLIHLRTDTHPPAYFVMLNLWSQLGSSVQVLRIPSVFLGVGTVAIVIAWLRQYSRLASILAGLAIATMPILLRYSQEIRHYSLLVFAAALAFLFASRVTEHPKRLAGYVGLALSLLLAVSSHLVGVMLLVPICVFIGLSAPGKRSVDCKKLAIGIALACAMFAFYYLVYLKGLGRKTADWWMPPLSLELATSVAKYTTGLSEAARPSTLNQAGPSISAWLAGTKPRLLIVALVLLSSMLGNWRRGLPFLVAGLLYILQVAGYSIVKKPILWPRTILPAVIPLVGFVGLQIATCRSRRIKILGAIAMLLLSLVYTADWITWGATRPTEAWKEGSGLLQSRWQKGDLVLVYPNYAKGLVETYFPELPPAAIIPVKIAADANRLDAAVSDRLSFLTTDGDLPVVFVVLRGDMTVQKDLDTYEKLLSVLQFRRREYSTLRVLLIACTDVEIEPSLIETRRELLAALGSTFGVPTSSQESDLFSYLEFRSLLSE